MSDTLGAGLVTASVGFGEAEHNELAAAQCTAQHFHTRHYPAVIIPQLEQVLDPIVAAFDEPFADASAIPTYYVSQNARRHVTVALSGDGGDEVFGGYDSRYVPHAAECLIRPWLPARPALGWLGARWPRSPRLPRALRLSTILENLGGEAVDAYYADLCLLKPFEARLLLGRPPVRDARDSPVYEAVTQPYRRCPSSSALQRAQYADLKGYLANDVLVKVDRMSMQHGLEIRCPLLDRRLVELAFRVPSRTKTPRLQPKHLLRALARKRLPRELLTLPKHGFSAPVGAWLAGPYANQFADQVLGRDSHVASLLDTEVVRRWFDEHRAGAMDRSQPLWMIWMLERWARSRRRPASPAPALTFSERM
jgi:asparagine synthase (glutamine-hydrolysing)